MWVSVALEVELLDHNVGFSSNRRGFFDHIVGLSSNRSGFVGS
jgi:hypothetical protein